MVQHVRKERHIPVTVPNIVIGGSYGRWLALRNGASCKPDSCVSTTCVRLRAD